MVPDPDTLWVCHDTYHDTDLIFLICYIKTSLQISPEPFSHVVLDTDLIDIQDEVM